MEKSHVGLEQCFVCGEDVGVLLDRRLKKSLPHRTCITKAPCSKCEEHMKNGIILISVNKTLTDNAENPYRSGGWVVIKEEAVRRIIQPEELLEDICKKRMAFVPDDAWDALGLPRGA